jgi:DNA-directed RNA polymerase subunit N (RpoN/RPB10)
MAVIKGINMPKPKEARMKVYDENTRKEALRRIAAGEEPKKVAKDLGIKRTSIYSMMRDEKKKAKAAEAVKSKIAETSQRLEAKVGERRPSARKEPAAPKDKMTYLITCDEEFIPFGSKAMAAVGIASLIESGFQPSTITLYEAKKLEFQAEIKAKVTID